jgi:pimeloyl-ACP methyl ester carboxylesterase
LAYTGTFPDKVKQIVAIEGLGPPPALAAEIAEQAIEQRLSLWVENRRENSGRTPRKYRTLEDAVARMQEENAYLNAAQARHLTIHGAHQNEDGTFSWKFDDYARWSGGVGGLSNDDLHRLWSCISCPVLLMRGAESWASDPVEDGRISHFRNATRLNFAGAGHWVHHDKLEEFMGALDSFLV